jgi:tetratricopeptide (TPR) repeat protein
MNAAPSYSHDGAEEVLRTVKAQKEEAKLFRDDGDLEGAVDVLQEAIALLKPMAPSPATSDNPSDGQKQAAWNLADTLGMLGGNYRRRGLLEDALLSCEEGRGDEENGRFGIESTYNLVTAIALPLEMGMRTATEQKSSLLSGLVALERATHGPRRLDRWAWADLGQTALLAGDLNRAKDAYSRFRELGDPASIGSHVTVLQRLSEALADRDPDAARALDQGIGFLERKGTES